MITSVDNCIKLRDDLDARYLAYQISTPPYLRYIEAIAWGGTRDRISRSMLGAINLAVPPFDEQVQIADYLDALLDADRSLVGQMERAASHLREYRAALITAAVTGQIDVRREVA